MFEDGKPKARPAYLPAKAIYERKDPLRRGRPGPAIHFDEEPVRQVLNDRKPRED